MGYGIEGCVALTGLNSKNNTERDGASYPGRRGSRNNNNATRWSPGLDSMSPLQGEIANGAG